MGRLRQEKIARGVTLHTNTSGTQVLRIEFQYKGIPCRETLKVKPDKTGQKYAINLKAEIENQIQRRTFNYIDYFPDSKRAAMFGQATSHQTISELLDEWLTDVKHANRNSTHGAYSRAVKQLKPEIGKFKVQHLDAKILKKMIRHWGHERGVTLKTIRNYLLPLRAILYEAMSENIINRNPLDQIKVAKLIDRQKIKSNKRTYEVDPFNPEEIKAVLSRTEMLYGESVRNLF